MEARWLDPCQVPALVCQKYRRCQTASILPAGLSYGGTVVNRRRRLRGGTLRTTRRAAFAVMALVVVASINVGCSSLPIGASQASTKTIATTNSSGACKPLPVSQHQTVTLAWSGPSEVWAPVILAQAHGLFTKENLTVNTPVVTGTNALLEMDKGQVDMLLGGINGSWLNSIADHSGFRIVAPGEYLNPTSNGFYVNNKYLTPSGKLNVNAIKNTTISVATGGEGGAIAPGLQAALKKKGLSLSDFSLTNLISSEALIALKTGAVSGGYLNPPESFEYLQAKLGKQFWTFTPGVPYAAFLASSNALASKKAALRSFFRAIQCAEATYLKGDYHKNSNVVQTIATATGVPVSALAGPAEYSWRVDLKFNPAGLQQLQTGWLGFGGILTYTKALKVNQVVNQSVVPTVQ